MSPDAVSTIACAINREWGSSGYYIASLHPGPRFGSAVAEVHAGDGSVFYVGADRWGNWGYAQSRDLLVAQLAVTS